MGRPDQPPSSERPVPLLPLAPRRHAGRTLQDAFRTRSRRAPPLSPLRATELPARWAPGAHAARTGRAGSIDTVQTTRAALALAAGLACLAGATGCGAERVSGQRPSLLLVVLDDARPDGLDRMPVLRERILTRAVVFENAFAPVALCAPSRASLLTGRDALTHGVWTVDGVIGGADLFRERGTDRDTLAVWLRTAGYRTGLFGKYLNAYWPQTEAGKGPGGGFYVPPGWDRWWALVSPEAYGGLHGHPYRAVREDGSVASLDDRSSDAEYSTDLSAETLREFVRESVAAGMPFFAVYAPYAPHVGRELPEPADRHLDQFRDLAAWRPPNWNEVDVADKPRWLQRLAPSAQEVERGDRVRQRAYESLLAVDEQLGAILGELDALGAAEHTVLVVTSDNGASWGAHRLMGQLKGCPYDECQRVPLLFVDPRLPPAARGPRAALVLNFDVPATLAELAGAALPADLDGRSFAGWLRNEPPAGWRTDYLIESRREQRSTGLALRGPGADGDVFELFHGDPMAQPRARTRFELDAGDGVADGALRVPLRASPRLTARELGLAVESSVPGVRSLVWPDADLVLLMDRSKGGHGLYGRVLVNRSGALEAEEPMPDFLGVRDLAAGLTYVEYETGERELYDLGRDPYQLENRAHDPAYTARRTRLARRLRELHAELSGRGGAR